MSKEFGSEDKLYCGTYCYNSYNIFSRSKSGAETRSILLNIEVKKNYFI
jgi:hypothetical protein